jgi:hypothetical protein
MTRIDDLKRAVAKAAVIVVCALLPAISSASQDTDAMKAGNTASTSTGMTGSHVYVVNGDVFVAHGNNPAHRVDGNEAVVSDTLINTGANSSALLKFEDGQIVTMQPDSSFQVREYRYDANKIENSNIVFSMFKGGMRFVTGLIGKARKQAFRLAAPNATIGIRGTEFMVAMADKSMYSQVLTGKITMTNAAGMKIVGAGQSAVVSSSTSLASLVSASAVPAGTFNELLSIPVDPSAISVPAPAPPVPAAEIGAAASVAGAAGGLMAGIAVSGSGSTQEAAPEAAPPVEAKPEPAPAPAEKEMPAEEDRSGVAITGKVGTLGVGAELNVAFSDYAGARLGYNSFKYTRNTTVSSVNYDVKAQLRTLSILGDWYPFAGGFRASAGLMYNDNNANYTGVPTGGTFDIGGQTFQATDVTSLKGTMSFGNVSPYLGIGWGNPVAKNKGWGMTTDIGVLFQGAPTTTLVATCSPTALPGACPTQSQVDAENAQMQDSLKNFKLWPVVSIGISYQW